MIKNKILNLKSNKGFTMYDLIIALVVFTMFVGFIGTMLGSTFEVQVDSQADEVAALYAIQVAEYIDKISFEQVETGIADSIATYFEIPSGYTLTIDVSDYKPENETESYVKTVNINLKYNYNNEDKNFSVNRLKIKEI